MRTDPNGNMPGVDEIEADLVAWLRGQTWSSFAMSLVQQYDRRGSLSGKQMASAAKMQASCRARQAARGPQAPAPEPGFYFADGSWYRVQPNKAGTRVYAKQWDGHDWEYVGRSPFAILTPEALVDAEMAAEFGHAFGRCLNCNAELTDPESVARGMGPVCATRFAQPELV